MRPHMAHINNTLIRKQLTAKAADQASSDHKYRSKVTLARRMGFTTDQIITELEAEMGRIAIDIRMGDALFLQGVSNAQRACIASIDLIISELKGEN